MKRGAASKRETLLTTPHADATNATTRPSARAAWPYHPETTDTTREYWGHHVYIIKMRNVNTFTNSVLPVYYHDVIVVQQENTQYHQVVLGRIVCAYHLEHGTRVRAWPIPLAGSCGMLTA